MAVSNFRSLHKILHCCLNIEFYPCFSVNVAVHTLISAIDHSLGKPLPYQQTNLKLAPQ